MRKVLMALLNNKGGKTKDGMKWTDIVRMLSEQSSVKINTVEFAEIVKGLENESVLKVAGKMEERVIRRMFLNIKHGHSGLSILIKHS